MALTKTVTYTQTQPQSLGFNNEISGTSGTVTVNIQYLPAMGRPKLGTYGASTSEIKGLASYVDNKSRWTITGTQSDVNTALNDLDWLPRVYADGLIKQDPRQEPQYQEYDGEFILYIKDDDDLIATLSDQRIQIILKDQGDTELLDDFFYFTETLKENGIYKLTGFFEGRHLHDGDKIKDFVKNLSTVKIGATELPIFDFIIRNPASQTDLEINVLDDGSLHDSGILTLVGELAIAEPAIDFVNIPNFEDLTRYMDSFNFATVSHPNDEVIGVQLLAKRYPSDPSFSGSVTTNKADYIEDNSYIMFDNVSVGRLTSKTYESDKIRWEFYGTPNECNQALGELCAISFGYHTDPRDFILEMRILSSNSKITDSKGIL